MTSIMSGQKYKFDKALEEINKNFIHLSNAEIELHNKILIFFKHEVTRRMSEKDLLFKAMFRRIFDGGSYYDGLKITQADEYDLDVLLNLPKISNPTVKHDTSYHKLQYPGHIRVKLNDMDLKRLYKQEEGDNYKKLMDLLCSNEDGDKYLSASKVRSWMESLIMKALNSFGYIDSCINFDIPSLGKVKLQVKQSKSGPAHTFHITGKVNSMDIKMDIDFVPCFVFSIDKHPLNLTREICDHVHREYFVVPKDPEGKDSLWRLSFQEQERTIIQGKEKLKPALKLIKRLRDNEGHEIIASYYLKTIFLWKCEEVDDSFWSSNSLSTVFMTMLKMYKDHLRNTEIKYYWNKEFNLLDGRPKKTIYDILRCMTRIIEDIERNNDEAVIIKYLSKSRYRPSPQAPDTDYFQNESNSIPTWAKVVIGESRYRPSPQAPDTDYFQNESNSIPTWAKVVIGVLGAGAAVTAAAVTVAAVVNNNQEGEHRRRNRQQNEPQNNNENQNCSLM